MVRPIQQFTYADASGKLQYVSQIVERVINDSVLILDEPFRRNGQAYGVDVAQRYEIWRPRTMHNFTELISTMNTWNNRRVITVHPFAMSADGYNIPGYFGAVMAAAVTAGLGLILSVVVHAASIQDQDGAKLVLANLTDLYEQLKVIFGDSAYKRNGLPDWVQAKLGCVLQPVLRPVDVSDFVVLPKRWIVERTFGWLGRYRRHSKDYECNPDSSVAMIHISMIKKMLNTLENKTVRV